MNAKRILGFFRILISFILAVLVFYIAFAWTASCRLEREIVKAEIEEMK